MSGGDFAVDQIAAAYPYFLWLALKRCRGEGRATDGAPEVARFAHRDCIMNGRRHRSREGCGWEGVQGARSRPFSNRAHIEHNQETNK
jgi:hypothetical protein